MGFKRINLKQEGKPIEANIWVDTKRDFDPSESGEDSSKFVIKSTDWLNEFDIQDLTPGCVRKFSGYVDIGFPQGTIYLPRELFMISLALYFKNNPRRIDELFKFIAIDKQELVGYCKDRWPKKRKKTP